MGWRPEHVRRATVFDFWCAWSGFVEFHDPEAANEPMTRARLDELIGAMEHGR